MHKYTCHVCSHQGEHHEEFLRCCSCGTVACNPRETDRPCCPPARDSFGDDGYLECPECGAFDAMLPLGHPMIPACSRCREAWVECGCNRQDEESHPEWLRAGREVQA